MSGSSVWQLVVSGTLPANPKPPLPLSHVVSRLASPVVFQADAGEFVPLWYRQASPWFTKGTGAARAVQPPNTARVASKNDFNIPERYARYQGLAIPGPLFLWSLRREQRSPDEHSSVLASIPKAANPLLTINETQRPPFNHFRVGTVWVGRSCATRSAPAGHLALFHP